MTFALYDYGVTDENGRSDVIATIEAGSLDEAKKIAKKEHKGSTLYLYNESAHGFVDDAG